MARGESVGIYSKLKFYYCLIKLFFSLHIFQEDWRYVSLIKLVRIPSIYIFLNCQNNERFIFKTFIIVILQSQVFASIWWDEFKVFNSQAFFRISPEAFTIPLLLFFPQMERNGKPIKVSQILGLPFTYLVEQKIFWLSQILEVVHLIETR